MHRNARCPARCARAMRSASRSSAAISRWAPPGTITHIDGNKVYAFGHPFFGLGPAQFPLTRAYVYAMLPSLMSSFKISSMGEVIGTMQQDRATAIAGTLGTGPAVVPMSVNLQSTREDGTTLVADVQLQPGAGPGVHAAPRLRRAREHDRRLRAAVRRRRRLRSRAARTSRGTTTWRSKTSSPARMPRSARQRPLPDPFRCSSPTIWNR